MTTETYGQFCPVAIAAEIVGPRWSLLLLSEMMSGSVRFNEIRRGVPRMSPALLSKRLKELQEWGLIERRDAGDGGPAEYHLTPPARELEPLIWGLGEWAQKWVDSTVTLRHLDAQLLMWNVRRKLNPDPMPGRQTVIQFIYPELPRKERNYWLILAPGQSVDLCSIDPGFDVDLFISADLLAMTKAFMGHSTLNAEVDDGSIVFTGDRKLGSCFRQWFTQSGFAAVLQ